MLSITTDNLLSALRAAGEPTRLRILALLAEGERSVKDLTDILGQSQPRISRHLKLLTDAGLVRRHAEGAWAFFRLSEDGPGADLATDLVARLDRDDPILTRDRARLEVIRRVHAETAAEYFRQHASRWDGLRSLHARDEQIENAILQLLGDEAMGTVIDLGTGTGRVLELLSGRIRRGIGIDQSHDMLGYARSRFERERLTNCQLRHGDIYNLPFNGGVADTVIIHQVLHYLDDPGRALHEASRLLKPGGRILVVDFAPHRLEFLRADHAHQRLGFARKQVSDWLALAGVATTEYLELSPDEADEAEPGRLTVSIWLGRRAGEPDSEFAEEAA